MLAGIDYLLSRARIEEAQEATRWLLGSLNNRGWEDVTPLLVTLAILALPLVLSSRPLRALELGDDAAYALGVRVERARLVARGDRRRARLDRRPSPWGRSPSSR